MKKTQSLKLNKDFRRLYSRGRSAAGRYTVVYAMKNREGLARTGFTTSKAIGNAVTRNRARRLMRESHRQLIDMLLPGYDLVIVARKSCAKMKMYEVMADMKKSLEKLHLLKNEKNNINAD